MLNSLQDAIRAELRRQSDEGVYGEAPYVDDEHPYSDGGRLVKIDGFVDIDALLRAILNAMRYPDEVTGIAAMNANSLPTPQPWRDWNWPEWTAAIDAILGEDAQNV